MLKTTYQEKFASILAGLNAEQAAAVNTIDGPVLVIAGPGTGKTQILAARIAQILVQTDTLPENILCLTYTDAGTIAMRKRLLEFVGPDAYRLAIHTFHSFCNMVIQDNLDVFGFRNLDPVDQLERIEIVREMVDAFGKDHALKRYSGDEYFEVNRLLALFDLLKKEDIQPDKLVQAATAYMDDLPNNPEFQYKRKYKNKEGHTFQPGDPNPATIAEEMKRMRQLIAAAQCFEPYNLKLQQRKRYDFADMILWVIKAFSENAGLLSDYQEKYLYVLVDEFQDTSGSQKDLLDLLLNYWDQPNVFAVGDEDQSIYRFQGARIENLKAFQEQYQQGLTEITLVNNYRSVQGILDSATQLLKANKERLSHDKTLIASNPSLVGLNQVPQIHAYPNPLQESAGIAFQIAALQKEGVPLNEVAVIYRNHKQADDILAYFNQHQIPYQTKRNENILKVPLIHQIITTLRYLNAETKTPHSGESFLFEMLHFNSFNIPTQEIAQLSVHITSRNFNERQTSWRYELKELARKKQSDLFERPSETQQIKQFSQCIETLIGSVKNQTVQELVHEVMNSCGYLIEALQASDQNWQMTMLNTFFDFVKDACSKHPSYQLKDIVRILDLMEEDEIPIAAERIYSNEEGVNLLTAHASKGLEFSYVFLLGVNSGKWDKTQNNKGYHLPPTMVKVETSEEEEARRLFYVAMTRAKLGLYISYSSSEVTGKPLEPSQFIAELAEAKTVESTSIQLSDEQINAFLGSILQTPEPMLPNSLLDSPFIDSLLEKYTLSVTHLNSFLHCPLSFYFNNFIKVPSAKNASLTFGSAVHYALELLFKRMNAHEEKSFGDTAELIRDFLWYMRRHADSFIPAEFERKTEYGEKVLTAYYQQYIHHWNKITSIEKSYRNVVVNGVPMNGKLDKLEFDGKDVNVVDYKTGNYKNAKKKFSRPDKDAVAIATEADKEVKFEDEHGGDYWRQAVFYKLLMDHDQTRDWEMKSCEFDFVEPDKDTGKFHKQQVVILSEDIQMVQEQVTEVYGKIKRKEFTQGCNKPDCEWCGFVKTYYTGKRQLTLPGINHEDIQ